MFNWFKKKDKTKLESTITNGPNFSDIDSHEKAENLYNQGELAKLYLLPLEFGGMDAPMNIVYVPEFVNMLKKRFDIMIEELLQEGKQLSYNASPEYKGKSFIPSKLNISVSGDAEFIETIQIW